MESSWHTKTVSETLQDLKSNEQGLTKQDSTERLQQHGPNKLPESKVDTLPIIFLNQFKSPLIYILIVASIAVFAIGEIVDGTIISIVLLFNSIIGTIQEGKAQNTLQALNRFVETKATVIREGKEIIISDSELSPGDIIILQEGEKIPADARIIIANNLKINEASLTGESVPKHKTADPITKIDSPIPEQTNMIFKGSLVLSGNCKAVVVATGLNTVIGKISKEISKIDTEIPLKKEIRRLSRFIIISVVIVSILLLIFGTLSGTPLREIFIMMVSLAISIIPEGLPIVITLVLAAGVWRMSKRNALVKKLQAVEALGQAEIIAVDKTGTITKNELVVQKIYTDEKFFEITGVGYEPEGEIKQNGNIVGAIDHPELILAGKISALLANAHVMFLGENKTWHITGDPTEAAMLVFAEKLGLCKDNLEQESPLIGELPFDYKMKYHVTSHEHNGKKFLAIAGAPEVILELSDKLYHGGSNEHLDGKKKTELEAVFNNMSQEGLRVVALAKIDEAPEALSHEEIRSLTFIGFLGMKDALRAEVAEAMQKTKAAGIRVVMITGDHELTAQAIAKEAGICKENDIVLTGPQIDSYSDAELAEKLDKTSVFARVTPAHKLKIINAYRNANKIIAMTGDGVNDAPSLVAADLGVAMGKVGTEVAKEASDIVLLDDNFGSIVSAIEEGRSIYKTIKKVVLYLLSTSCGEILTIGAALLLGFPIPILPAHIIWLNFVTDGFLDVALAMEPKEDGLINDSKKHKNKKLVGKLMAKRIFIMAIPMMLGTIFLFQKYFATDINKAWTISFTTLAVFQWLNAWNCRHESKSIFNTNPFSNRFLLAATPVVILLQLLAIYNPLMQKFLKTSPLTISEWGLIILVSTSIIIFEEIRKLFYRRKYG